MVKGNALLALSSLAVVVSKHEASLCSDSDGVLEVSWEDLGRVGFGYIPLVGI